MPAVRSVVNWVDMGWIILPGLGAAALLIVLFVLVTDGRYFGKRLTYWVYDFVGPVVFSARSEAKQWHALLVSIDLRGSESILDVGTAAGDLPLSIAGSPDFQGQAVGVDWSPRMIEAARREASRRGLEGRARFEVVDVRKGLPFAAGEFDVVFCLGLLETLPEPERVLEELKRVLKLDGVMVLSLEWYEQHLGTLGLGDLKVVPCRGHHDVVIARSSRKG
ncbi:MAG: class I SAM-dependent methyltransferase [Anaerolineae bacterium]|nr:class I SAM-dependent methyltransferase [Anaerolineae bacterium]